MSFAVDQVLTTINHREQVFAAINQLAKELKLYNFTEVTHDIHCPSAMSNLAGVAWIKNIEMTDAAKIVHQELTHLWTKGCLSWLI